MILGPSRLQNATPSYFLAAFDSDNGCHFGPSFAPRQHQGSHQIDNIDTKLLQNVRKSVLGEGASGQKTAIVLDETFIEKLIVQEVLNLPRCNHQD